MKKKPRSRRVSVVVPTYNQASYLPLALDSIAEQTHRDWEAIVVNDGSTDGTAAIADEYARRDPRFKVIHKENGGVASALNAGLEAATGGYFCWLSSDDMYLPNKLESQIRAFDTVQRKAGIVVSGFHHIDPVGNVIHTAVANPEATTTPLANLILHGNFINGCTIMVPMDVMRRVGPFSTRYRYAQDYDMWTRICLEYPIAWLDEVLVSYRVHPEQGSATLVPDCLVDSYVIIHEILRTHSLTEVMKGFSLSDQPHLDETLSYLVGAALFEHSWINSDPLNTVFWEWVAANLKTAIPPDAVGHILQTLGGFIAEQRPSVTQRRNVESIVATLDVLDRIAPFRSANEVSTGGARSRPAEGQAPSIAFTALDMHAFDDETVTLMRYVEWLQELGVDVTLYAGSPAPEGVVTSARYKVIEDANERYSAMEEPVVVLASAEEILPVLRADPREDRLYHLCQGYEGYRQGVEYEEAIAEKPRFDFLYRLPVGRIVGSRHLAGLLAKKANQPVHLIPNGVDLGVFAACESARGKGGSRVVVVGDPASPRHGVNDLESALGIVSQRNPGWRLELDVVWDSAADHDSPSALGFVERTKTASTPERLRDIYCAADLVVAPSWYEGFCLPVAQAMACGVPVVAARSGGLEDYCIDGENCLLVSAHDPEAMADAIEKMLADDGLRERLAEEALRSARGLSLGRQFDAFVPAFEEILGIRFDEVKVRALRSRLSDGRRGLLGDAGVSSA